MLERKRFISPRNASSHGDCWQGRCLCAPGYEGYDCSRLARQLIGERVTTFKRALEMLVWLVFDSGICLTILVGLPYVRRGELQVGTLIDCFCKLNFNVNFCLREILEQLPRMARLLEREDAILSELAPRP